MRTYVMGIPAANAPPGGTIEVSAKPQVTFRPRAIKAFVTEDLELLHIQAGALPIFESAANEDIRFDGYPLSLAIVDPALLDILATVTIPTETLVTFRVRNTSERTRVVGITLIGDVLE